MKQRMKILIGYDGSGCAEAALDDLQRAGLPSAAEALVLSVTEVSLPLPPPSSYEILEQARAVHVPADLMRVYAKDSPAVREALSIAGCPLPRLRASFPGWQVTAQAAVGSPARQLVNKADEWKPDLIVVGSHGRSAAGRLLLGSVSQGVLTYAHSSVRVARGRVEEPGGRLRLVVGLDGSTVSLAALNAIESRMWPDDSEVRVVAVADPLTPTFVGQFIPLVAKTIEESNQAYRVWLEKMLKSASERLRQCGLKVSTEILKGDPKRVLVEVAKDWGADSVFVGAIGFGNLFERFLLGSVSASVAARAHCSVEVVRPRKRKGENNHERQFEYSLN